MKIDIDLKFEDVREKVTFRVVGENKINDYVKQDAGKLIYDVLGKGMYMVYVIEVDNRLSMVFTDVLLEQLECSKETVVKWAKKNTEKKHPPVLSNMENILLGPNGLRKELFSEMTEESIEENQFKNNMYSSNLLDSEHMMIDKEDGQQMHVLTNSNIRYGASVVFYDGLLRRISRMFGDDLFLIPSSIHEMIVLPKYAGIEKNELENMLNDVNDHFLEAEEILSQKVLFYDEKKGMIV